jgi:hypothetical protein
MHNEDQTAKEPEAAIPRWQKHLSPGAEGSRMRHHPDSHSYNILDIHPREYIKSFFKIVKGGQG